jgi:hypothetical protein
MWPSLEPRGVCSEPFSSPSSIHTDFPDRCVTPAYSSGDGCQPGACVNPSDTFSPSPPYSVSVLRSTSPVSGMFCWHQQCLPATWTLCWPSVSTHLPGKHENHHIYFWCVYKKRVVEIDLLGVSLVKNETNDWCKFLDGNCEIEFAVFWNVMPYSLAYTYQHFREA